MAKNGKDKRRIPPVKRVKGVRDLPPHEHAKRKHVLEIIESVFHCYGYQGVEVPTIEPMELHLRKSGESIRRHMYQFEDLGGENLCLRPELTASVARMYNQELSSWRKPLRLHYCGQTFRYDRPQKGRYREFTQVGIEIVGGSGPEYDAEGIAIACHTMDALGISDYRMTIGNIGIALDFLKEKNVLEKAQGVILGRLEDIGKRPDWEKAEKLIAIEKALKDVHIPVGPVSQDHKCIIDAVDQICKATRHTSSSDSDRESPIAVLVAWVLDQAKVVDSRRASEDASLIARNLLTKVERYKQGPIMREVLDFLAELMEISGSANEVFPRLYALLEKHELDTSRVKELELAIQYLEQFGIDWSKVTIDFAFGRGLEYYTGTIFEIHCESDGLGETQTQVCGGGRYDTLISDVRGGRYDTLTSDVRGHENVPALGFSFGLERLVLAMTEGDLEDPILLDVLVAPIGGENEFLSALRLSCQLRKQNLRTLLGRKGQDAKAHTGMAERLRAPFVIYLGENELKNNSVTLKNLNTGEELECTFDEAVETIRKGAKKK